MIVQTKNGIMLHGEIAKDPVLRDAGQKRVLKFDLKASRTQDESGKWQSFFVGVNLWHGIDQWDGMLQKGDQVTVFAQKLKEREYNGKIYYDVDADDVQPGGLVTFRWLQQMIDLMAQPGPPPEPAEPAATRQTFRVRRCTPVKLLRITHRAALLHPKQPPLPSMTSSTMMPTTCRSDLASCAIRLYGHFTRKEVGLWASTQHAAS